MVIELSELLFNNEHNLKDVNFLVSILSDNRRYEIFCEIGEIKTSIVYQKLISIQKEIIEECYNKVVTENLEISYLIDETSSHESFDINEAKRFFNQPFKLILENSLYDGFFINSLIDNFRNKSKKIRSHKENGWFEYGNGGGLNGIINFIASEKDKFNDLPKPQYKYLRCMILVDSDKKFPSDTIKQDRINLCQFLDENHIEYHFLHKREIENYVPAEVLKIVFSGESYIEAYLRLTAIQQDYFDLEKGFDNKNLNSLDSEIQALYHDVDKEDIKVLRKGMENEEYKKDDKFKSAFPLLFNHAAINQTVLKNRVSHQEDKNELETILNKISSLL